MKPFTPLDTDQNRSNSANRLSLVVDQIHMSGNELVSKFTYAPTWGREQNLICFLGVSIFQSHLTPSHPQRSGYLSVFLIFGVYSSRNSPSCAFWEFWLFSPIEPFLPSILNFLWLKIYFSSNAQLCCSFFCSCSLESHVLYVFSSRFFVVLPSLPLCNVHTNQINPWPFKGCSIVILVFR